ncbi:MAG: type II toxin-antitoxin system RelE/ParE family toxin [Planctomycetota bacterium]
MPGGLNRAALAGLRSFPVKGFDKHLIFYRSTEHGIEVLRVLHGARDLGTIFEE